MKKIQVLVLTIALTVVGIFSGHAQIKLGSLNGGDYLPANGNYIIWYTNEVPLATSVFLDKYDALSNYVASINLVNYQLRPAGVDYTMLWPDEQSILPGLYRVHITGIDSNGISHSDIGGFISIGPDATLVGTVNSTNGFWTRSDTKSVTITWSGFAPGNICQLGLVASEQWVGEGYGFALTNIVLPTSSGSITVEIPYPNNNQAWDTTPGSDTLVDGGHQFFAYVENGYIRNWFGQEDMVVSDFRVKGSPANTIDHAYPGSTVWLFDIQFDARFATNDIVIAQLPLSLYTYWSSNLVMDVNLYTDESLGTFIDGIAVNDQSANGKELQLETFEDANIVILKGTVQTVHLQCMFKQGCGTGELGWFVGEGYTPITATFTDGIPASVGIVYSSGNDIQVRNQEFALNPGLNMAQDRKSALISATVKTNAHYMLQRSLDLVTWSNLRNIHTTSNTSISTNMDTSLHDKAFFRFIELVP